LLRKELGIATFKDLLFHFPYRYFDRTQVTKIGAITPASEFIQLAGTMINIAEEGEGRKRRLVATLFDETGKIELIWFQNISWVRKTLEENRRYIVFGKISSFNGYVNIAHPEVEAITAETAIAGMQPVYSSTQKLIAKGITNRSFAKLTQPLFE
jgi:ATP-dependent DNA helicase RecG